MPLPLKPPPIKAKPKPPVVTPVTPVTPRPPKPMLPAPIRAKEAKPAIKRGSSSPASSLKPTSSYYEEDSEAGAKADGTPLASIFPAKEIRTLTNAAGRIVQLRAEMAGLEKEKKATHGYIEARIESWREENPEDAAMADKLTAANFSIIKRTPAPRAAITPESLLLSLQTHLPELSPLWGQIIESATTLNEFKPYYTIYARGEWSPRSKAGKNKNGEDYDE